MHDTAPDVLDICIPTWESGAVLGEALDKLRKSVESSEAKVGKLIVVDNESNDETRVIAKDKTDDFDWEYEIRCVSSSLPEAREMAIEAVREDWFLFLDDDVRLSEDYISSQLRAVSPATGAVQGRKKSKINPEQPGVVSDTSTTNTDWVRKRSFRGGTHATLVRTEAAKGVDFPHDLEVWEDEYLRRHIEDQGYLWVFNHQAVFSHDSQERHSPGWKSGFLQAKYELRPFWHVLLNIPYAVLTGKSPLGFIKMAGGYLAGKINRRLC